MVATYEAVLAVELNSHKQHQWPKFALCIFPKGALVHARCLGFLLLSLYLKHAPVQNTRGVCTTSTWAMIDWCTETQGASAEIT